MRREGGVEVGLVTQGNRPESPSGLRHRFGTSCPWLLRGWGPRACQGAPLQRGGAVGHFSATRTLLSPEKRGPGGEPRPAHGLVFRPVFLSPLQLPPTRKLLNVGTPDRQLWKAIKQAAATEKETHVQTWESLRLLFRAGLGFGFGRSSHSTSFSRGTIGFTSF